MVGNIVLNKKWNRTEIAFMWNRIIESMGIKMSKLQETVKDREARCAVVIKNGHDLTTEWQQSFRWLLYLLKERDKNMS